MELAPIVLFVYNRPEHTRACLESLATCELAPESELIVFADAVPKNYSKTQREAVKTTQDLFTKNWGFRKINFHPRSHHLGLAENILQGINEVFEKYPRAIILEDDLLFTSHTLKYLNQALELYADAPQVMQINAFVPPLKGIKLPDTFFYRAPFTWGWATWARAWQYFNPNLEALVQKLEERNLMSAFDLDDSGIFRGHIESNLSGKIHTWAIRWQASIFLEKGLCLTPANSLTQNIGFDGSGVNCPQDESHHLFFHKTLSNATKLEKIPFQEHQGFRKSLRSFYHFGGSGIKVRLIYYKQQLWNRVGNSLPKSLKNFYRSLKSITFGLEQKDAQNAEI